MSERALSVLFEGAPGALIDGAGFIAQFGDDAAALTAAGLLREEAPAANIVCAACSAPHRIDVAWSEDRRVLGQYCAEGGGWSETPTDALRQLSFDHGQFLAALSLAFGITRMPEPLMPEICWRLGATSIEGSDCAVFVAREMHDPRRLVEVAAALKRRIKAGPGAVLCGAHPLVDLGLLPRGFRAVQLDDVVAIGVAGGLKVDQRALALALGLIARRRGEHGAPFDHPGLIALIEVRARNAQACSTATEEADWLLLHHRSWVEPGRHVPLRETLRRFIARRRTK